jgi:hypothetical protein
MIMPGGLLSRQLIAAVRCQPRSTVLASAMRRDTSRPSATANSRDQRRPLPNASIDAVLAAIGRLETVADARELMAPFAEHHGKDAVEACLDWPSPNGMLADDGGRIGRWRS